MNPSLYRYSSAKYNRLLLEKGSVRIGTLYDFRRAEHKLGISDPQEGKKKVSHYIDRWEKFNPTAHNELHSKASSTFNIFKIPDGSNFIMENVTLTQQFDDPDCFVHCTSHTLSRSVLRQFDGADNCVEIFDTQGFYSRLTRKLNLVVPVTLEIVAKVTYGDRAEIWNGENWGVPPSMLKGNEFIAQCEVRAIWRPDRGIEIEPVIIEDKRLSRYCRLAKL